MSSKSRPQPTGSARKGMYLKTTRVLLGIRKAASKQIGASQPQPEPKGDKV